MALLDSSQIGVMWESGLAEKFGLYAVKNCNTGDTIDMSGHFRVISQAVWMGATVQGAEAGSATGSTLTVPAGLTTAGAYVLVAGVAF